MNLRIRSFSCLFLLALGHLASQAGTNGFVVPSFRGSPLASYSGWDTLKLASGGPNAPDLPGSSATGSLLQLDPNAIATGSGNIYNMNAKSSFELTYSSLDPIGLDRVTLQVRTAGTELDYNSVVLTTLGGTPLGTTRTELDRQAFGTPGQPGSGFFVSSQWEWSLATYIGDGYKITFAAADSSLSFDSATLDTLAFVPEPSTVALGVIGAVALAFMSWRRR